MSDVVTIYKTAANAIQWLPVVPLTLDDYAPCNGWILVKFDDGCDPSISRVFEVQCHAWVDEVVPSEYWEYDFLFLSVIIDPSDWPYFGDDPMPPSWESPAL